MTTSVAKPHQIAEVAGLAASIAARIIEKQVEGLSIRPELFRHLVLAAQILTDNGAPWPPSVELIVTEVGRRVATDQARSEWIADQTNTKPCRQKAMQEALCDRLTSCGYSPKRDSTKGES